MINVFITISHASCKNNKNFMYFDKYRINVLGSTTKKASQSIVVPAEDEDLGWS